MRATGLRPDAGAVSRAAKHASAAFLVWMAIIGILAWTALLMLH